MPEEQTVPLLKAEDKEESLTWKSFPTPSSFLDWLITKVFVKVSQLTGEGIIVQTSTPSSADASKLWINNAVVSPSLAYFIGNKYVHWYEYPVGTPFIWPIAQGDLLEDMTALTNSELSIYGLTAPTDSSQWVTYDPDPPS